MAGKGKITLISVKQYGTSMGVRPLSTILKRAGYETVVIFVHGAVSREVAMGWARVFDDSIHDAIAELAAGSLITPTYHATRELTLRMGARSGAPIIWGGVYPIVRLAIG